MFLGIDCGTQGSKALILDSHSGKVLGRGAAAHTLEAAPNGRREQEPAQWIEACVIATRHALSEAGIDGQQIEGVGVSGQQHGLVMLDADGQVLRPAKLWCDTETTAENDRLLDYLGGAEGSLQRLGVVIAPGYTVSKLLWSKEQFPHLFEQLDSILLPHDYLNYWLTGRRCSEFGDASGTGYFDVRQRRWDLDLLAHIDPGGRLQRALPELLQAHESVGKVLPDVARRLGISAQARVSSGGGDNMMAAIGTGNIVAGEITMSLGSSGTVYAYSDDAVINPSSEVATFCSSSGGWLPLICTMNLTNVTSAIRDLFALELGAFNQHVAQAPIGADGIVMLPFLNGERVPNLPHAQGSLHGLTSTNLSQANLCRAAVEGTTFGLRYGLDLLRDSGLPCHSIRLVGGGAKSEIWRQIVADIMGVTVVCTEEPEAAALGAAIQAAWCVSDGSLALQQLSERCVRLNEHSLTVPKADNAAAYERIYADYRQRLAGL